MKSYSRGQHTVYYHRYHIVWITKYRYKILTRPVKERIREIIAQVAAELGVGIENGVVSTDHLHVFVSIPPHVAVSDFIKRAKGRHRASSNRSFLS